MMTLPNTANMFLYSRPTDIRKSFCGLSGIVRSELGREPTDGSLFLFINRRKDKLKALYWDTDGISIYQELWGIRYDKQSALADYGDLFPDRAETRI